MSTVRRKTKDGLAPLTAGEKLLISRQRLGWSQRRAAKHNSTTLTIYSRWERDVDIARGMPRPAIGKLSASEKCVVYRRRMKLSQKQVAEKLGRCRFWVNKMETGREDCTELVQFYEC